MSHRRSPALVIALTCAVAGTAPALGQASAPEAAPPKVALKEDAKATQILAALQKRLGAAKTLSTRATQRMTIEMGPMKQNMDAIADFALDRTSNKLALQHIEGMQGSTLVSDGEKMTYYMPMAQAYTIRKAPMRVETLFDPAATMELGVLDTGVLPFLSMFVNPKDAKGIMDGIAAGRIGTEYLGDEEVKGKKCEKIRLTLGADALGGIMGPMMPMGDGLSTTMDLWIARDADAQPVLRRVSPDLDALMKAMQEMEEADAMFDMGEMKMTMVIDLERWTVDQPVDAKMFTFVKPDGANEVDDMMATIQEMAGGMGMDDEPGMGAEADGPEKKLLGKAAPDFALEQLGGSTVTNETLKGKIVVLDFWATWCGPCIRAMPILEKVTKSFKDKDVVFFAINLQESAEQVRGFLTKKGFDIDVLMDTDGKVANKYFVGGIPQTVIIGKDGSVQAVHVGMAPGLEKRLTEELELLISHGHLVHDH